MSELVLGIDIGTSSSKGVLARPAGTIVAVAEPVLDRSALYDTLYAMYRALFPATREAMHTLADLQLGAANRDA